jgi:hypothetical protein
MNNADSTLWTLERQFWLAGADVYRRHVADEAVMVFPGLVLTKAQAVASIETAPRWVSVSFSEQRVVPLTPEVIGLVYRASASREHEPSPYTPLVTSLYIRRGHDWQLALHQQSI